MAQGRRGFPRRKHPAQSVYHGKPSERFFRDRKSIDGEFELAAIAVLASCIFDILDGKVARMDAATSSRFGVEYDSLADLVAFGVPAPGLMI